MPADVEAAWARGARGIGLFRSEYLYLTGLGEPSEERQYQAYAEVARKILPESAIIRTVDLGGDKVAAPSKTPPESNPFLGWRAIRLCLDRPTMFKTQLRAILRASAHNPKLRIMYPMVGSASEVDQADALLAECKAELAAAGVAFNPDIEVGVMIEIPSAALTADLIAPKVKFFSIGTNDLVQYTLAVDRGNERIARLYEPTHPAVLQLIRHTVEAGRRHGIWTGVCGEVAGNPILVPLLLGLGVEELSASPGAIPLVKDVVRHVRFAEAQDLAEAAQGLSTGAEILDQCRALVRRAAPEILELGRIIPYIGRDYRQQPEGVPMSKNTVFTSESVSEGHPTSCAMPCRMRSWTPAWRRIPRAAWLRIARQDRHGRRGRRNHHEGHRELRRSRPQGRLRNRLQPSGSGLQREHLRRAGCHTKASRPTSPRASTPPRPKARPPPSRAPATKQMFGYACDETPELMPMPIILAHRIMRTLTDLRKAGKMPWVRPDSKSQVSVEYDANGKPVRVDTIVVSTQHAPHVSNKQIRKEIIER
jgi:hypothetical protein